VALAPFSDEELFRGRTSALAFWSQTDFYGVDLSVMASRAADEIFSMPALGTVGPETLVARPALSAFDFERLPFEALAEIPLPFQFDFERPTVVHGLAGWFDVAFEGSDERVVLTTSPEAASTHWSQLRFVLIEPLTVREGQRFAGTLTLLANAHSSYTARLEGELAGVGPITPQTFHLENFFPVEEPLATEALTAGT
jgi:histone-arginine methyltransferase CARM1